jgi:hypothetical protein
VCMSSKSNRAWDPVQKRGVSVQNQAPCFCHAKEAGLCLTLAAKQCEGVQHTLFGLRSHGRHSWRAPKQTCFEVAWYPNLHTLEAVREQESCTCVAL